MEQLFDNDKLDISSNDKNKRAFQIPIGNGLIEFE